MAIINAQTLRNPFSAERQRLVALLRDHGDVEYIPEAFKGVEVVREADVEVALIRLVKPAECAEDWIGPVIATMAVDRTEEVDYHLPGELALPNSFVSNQVRAFRVAVKAMREAIRMKAVALHYAMRIGRTLDDLANGRGEKATPSSKVRERLEKEFDSLKDRAWAAQRALHAMYVEAFALPSARARLNLEDAGRRRRYPRLLRAMEHAALLTPGEADSALRALLRTHPMGRGHAPASCEAVAHFGGNLKVARAARRWRQRFASTSRALAA